MKLMLETERLRFRRFELTDAEELFHHHREAELVKWIPNESYASMEETNEAIAFFGDCVDKGKLPYVMAIVMKENGKMIGDAGINEVEGGSGEVEVGFSICEGYQGNGYAKEALKAITQFAAAHFKANVLYGRILHGNTASIKVVKGCGYVFAKEEFGAADDPYCKGMLIYIWQGDRNDHRTNKL
jgi:ribosomal-protein-alanine N-acetyltransferase